MQWAAVFTAALLGGRPATAQVLYIDDAYNQLGTVDIATGQTKVIGSMNSGLITDIAFSPTGQLYGLSTSDLYRINPTTGAATLVGRHNILGGNALVFGTDGTLYAAGGYSTNLYTLDPTTGASTRLGNVGFASAGDLAFNNGNLYLSSGSNQLVRINLAGAVTGTAVGYFGFSGVLGMADAANGVLYGVAGTQVFSINTTTGAGTLVRNYAGGSLARAFGTSFYTEAQPPSSTVPEPTTVALLGVGLAAVSAGARRRVRG